MVELPAAKVSVVEMSGAEASLRDARDEHCDKESGESRADNRRGEESKNNKEKRKGKMDLDQPDSAQDSDEHEVDPASKGNPSDTIQHGDGVESQEWLLDKVQNAIKYLEDTEREESTSNNLI